jgi:hypothetical protein
MYLDLTNAIKKLQSLTPTTSLEGVLEFAISFSVLESQIFQGINVE